MKSYVRKYLSSKIIDLKNKSVFILGGTGTIGSALIESLVYKGANIVLGVRNIEKTKKLIHEIRTDSLDAKIQYIEIDLMVQDSIASCVSKLQELPIDYIIINSGIESLDKETCMRVNCESPVQFMKLLGNKYRYIVTSSISCVKVAKSKNKEKDSYAYSKYQLLKESVNLIKEQVFEIKFLHPGIVYSSLFIRRHPKVKWFYPIIKHFMLRSDVASLLFLYSISHDIPLGYWIIPKGLFQLKGSPKTGYMPKKLRQALEIE